MERQVYQKILLPIWMPDNLLSQLNFKTDKCIVYGISAERLKALVLASLNLNGRPREKYFDTKVQKLNHEDEFIPKAF